MKKNVTDNTIASLRPQHQDNELEDLYDKVFLDALRKAIDFKENPFHPLVWVRGTPKIGKNVYIGMMSVINCKHCEIVIGDNCDIGPLVNINCADSHMRCLGLADRIDRKPIKLGKNVFVGCNAVIIGGTEIGHHSVIGAGTVVRSGKIPPYSLVFGNPAIVKPGYYKKKFKK